MKTYLFLGFIFNFFNYSNARYLTISRDNRDFSDCDFINLTTIFFHNATGKKINDIGDMNLCLTSSGKRYAIMKVSVESLGVDISWGICGPKGCSLENQSNSTQEILKFINYSNAKASFQFPDEENIIFWNFGAFFMAALFIVLIGLAILGSLYEITQILTTKNNEISSSQLLLESNENQTNSSPKQKVRSFLQRFSICFSLKTNIGRLLSRSEKSPLNIFNGIRVISMLWIIAGHLYSIRMIGPILNIQDFVDFQKRFLMTFITQATVSVDIFFFLSGFLCAQVLYKEIKIKLIKTNFLMIQFHRLYRIWPLYLFVLFFAWQVLPHWNSGPLWKKYKDSWPYCERYWWTNALFINNLVPWDSPASCIGWTWYLANDMQFYLITPFLILIFCYKKWIGYFLPTILLFGSWITIFVISQNNKISTSFVNNNQGEQFRLVYIKPYARISAYLIGILSAFIFVQMEEENDEKSEKKLTNFTNKILKSRLNRLFFYVVGIGLMMVGIFLPQDAQINPNKWSKVGDCIYLAVQRSIFVLGLLLLTWPSLIGQGSGIKFLFGSDFWTPLARITQGAYLVHPLVIVFYVLGSKFSYYYEDWEQSLSFIAYAVISYIVAFVLSLLIEAPMQAVEKEFWRKKSKEDNIKKQMNIFKENEK